MADKKRIVVVGGGVAGTIVAKNFDAIAKVTLIDPKEYYEVPFAKLRCVVEPDVAKRSVMKHSEYLKNSQILQTAAKSVSRSEVLTSSGETIPYDFLVISTGTTYSGPETKAELLKEYQAEHKKLEAAQSVLIIGGGPVGVELAGEIVVDYPDKKVTLVHGGQRLIEFLGTKASQKALKWLQSKKVEIILNDRLDTENLVGPNYVTKNGKHIKADAHFVCIGKRVGSSWLTDSELANLLDNEGRLKITPSMRVEGQSNIFAIGDIANTKEIKQGYFAVKQAGVVIENIKKLIKDPNASKLSEYKPVSSPMALVSLGRNLGLMQMPLGTMLGRMPGMIKSKDLFVTKSRKDLGLAGSPQ